MIKKLPIVFVILLALLVTTSCSNNEKSKSATPLTTAELQAKHKEILENSPFQNTAQLSKKERAMRGLSPKRYMERLWELTVNPAIGRPTPENLAQIQKELIVQRKSALTQGRVPGDDSKNNWVERGPDNVGGRTRALLFDPNDASNETVFAGGVSGGLWKNTNISDAGSVWTSVDIPENLNISCITVDPNNSKIMYVGTGESYVYGDVNGNGVWKSTDGGNSWAHIFGGAEGETVIQTGASLTVNSPSDLAGNFTASTADFGSQTAISGDLVLATDGTSLPYEACNALTNSSAINGKIAFLYRGSCDFVIKVKHAQDAGAIGVVVVNNEPGAPAGMGGDDPNGDITIPSIMISMADGSQMRSALDAGTTINVSFGFSDFAGYYVLNGNQHVNDVLVRDNNGVSELYVAAGSTAYFDANPATLLGPDDFGLYKSVDAGNTWSATNLPVTQAGSRLEPNDIELGADNNIYVATRNSLYYSDGGGIILSSPNGDKFRIAHTVERGNRTQIATSATDPNKIYVLAQGDDEVPVIIEKTTDGFATTTALPLPDDVGPGIPADDFCRNQAYYNLVIKTDPTNDETVFVGGIDLFKSVDGGNAWDQLSHWYGYSDLTYMHADQHAIVFGNNDTSKMIFGNDGGVYFSEEHGENPDPRNNGYNVTQFYTVAVSPTSPFQEELILAGSQDNGNQMFQNVNPGINSTTDITGGDGAATFFDQDGEDTYLITNYVYNAIITKIDYTTGVRTTIREDEEDSNGEFINIQALDSRLDYLFSNFSSGSNYSYITYRTKEEEEQASFIVDTISSPGILNGSPTAMAVSPYQTEGDHSTLYLGLDNGRLLKVGNASATTGQTWDIISDVNFVGSISDVEFGQSSNDIFVTFHNYGVNNIWYSNDGGTTWSQKDGDLPDLPVKAILQNPLNLEEVVVGTELGVWYTSDFSSDAPTWKSAFNGMSNVKVMDLDLRDDNTIYAATYGRGVFSGKFTAESLSVEENVLASGISLYPTVSNGEFKVNSKTNLGTVNLQIFNLNGQSVYVKDLNLSGSNPVDINIKAASGVYLARFTEGGTTTTKKFIIK